MATYTPAAANKKGPRPMANMVGARAHPLLGFQIWLSWDVALAAELLERGNSTGCVDERQFI